MAFIKRAPNYSPNYKATIVKNVYRFELNTNHGLDYIIHSTVIFLMSLKVLYVSSTPSQLYDQQCVGQYSVWAACFNTFKCWRVTFQRVLPGFMQFLETLELTRV